MKKGMGCLHRLHKIYYRLVKCQIATLTLMKQPINWKKKVFQPSIQFRINCCFAVDLNAALLHRSNSSGSNASHGHLWLIVCWGCGDHIITALSYLSIESPGSLDHMRSQAVSQKHLSSCHPFFTSFTAQLYCTLSIHECSRSGANRVISI